MTSARLIALALLLTSCAVLSAPRQGPLLRVMTYNIHAGKDARQTHNLERVAQLVKDVGADIVFLQEIDRGTQRAAGEDQLATLARLTGMHPVFAKSLDYQGGDYGIALLSRAAVDSAHTVRLDVQPRQERAGGSYEPRVGLHAWLRTQRGLVHLVNTHLDPAAQPTYRHQEIMQLLAHIRQHGGETAPIIFGGDLNARPATPEIQALALVFDDGWTRCGGNGPGFTFPSHAPDRRIDYLLLRGLHCTRAAVLDTDASDHRPLLITIQR